LRLTLTLTLTLIGGTSAKLARQNIAWSEKSFKTSSESSSFGVGIGPGHDMISYQNPTVYKGEKVEKAGQRESVREGAFTCTGGGGGGGYGEFDAVRPQGGQGFVTDLRYPNPNPNPNPNWRFRDGSSLPYHDECRASREVRVSGLPS